MKVNPIIKTDRTEVDKVLAEMKVTENIKAAINSYQIEMDFIEEREKQLKQQLQQLQEKLTKNLLVLETEKDVTKIIEIKKENYGFNQESKIIEALLEEIEEDKIALKVRYSRIYKEALRKDLSVAYSYATDELEKTMKAEMTKAIEDVKNEKLRQFNAVQRDVLEVYEDKAVKEIHPPIYWDYDKFSRF